MALERIVKKSEQTGRIPYKMSDEGTKYGDGTYVLEKTRSFVAECDSLPPGILMVDSEHQTMLVVESCPERSVIINVGTSDIKKRIKFSAADKGVRRKLRVRGKDRNYVFSTDPSATRTIEGNSVLFDVCKESSILSFRSLVSMYPTRLPGTPLSLFCFMRRFTQERRRIYEISAALDYTFTERPFHLRSYMIAIGMNRLDEGGKVYWKWGYPSILRSFAVSAKAQGIDPLEDMAVLEPFEEPQFLALYSVDHVCKLFEQLRNWTPTFSSYPLIELGLIFENKRFLSMNYVESLGLFKLGVVPFLFSLLLKKQLVRKNSQGLYEKT